MGTVHATGAKFRDSCDRPETPGQPKKMWLTRIITELDHRFSECRWLTTLVCLLRFASRRCI